MQYIIGLVKADLKNTTGMLFEPELNLSVDEGMHVDHLTSEQQMLREESSAFARHKNKVGYINKPKKITDSVPVAALYNAISQLLYDKVKSHIQDLLNNDFIRKSTSSCASAVVCVRKRDGSLRLCIDYRGLNKNTVLDRALMGSQIKHVFHTWIMFWSIAKHSSLV